MNYTYRPTARETKNSGHCHVLSAHTHTPDPIICPHNISPHDPPPPQPPPTPSSSSFARCPPGRERTGRADDRSRLVHGAADVLPHERAGGGSADDDDGYPDDGHPDGRTDERRDDGRTDERRDDFRSDDFRTDDRRDDLRSHDGRTDDFRSHDCPTDERRGGRW